MRLSCDRELAARNLASAASAIARQGDNRFGTSPRSHGARATADGLSELSFEPEELSTLLQAMDEALAFLQDLGHVGPAKRRQVALAILQRAKSGLRDPHRLAVKGVLGVV